MDVQQFQKACRRFQIRRRIMVSRDDDDILNALALMQLLQKIIVLPRGLVGRRMAIENIAGDNQRVDVFPLDGLDNMVQKRGGFVDASPPLHLGAKMPVGCVKEQHFSMINE